MPALFPDGYLLSSVFCLRHKTHAMSLEELFMAPYWCFLQRVFYRSLAYCLLFTALSRFCNQCLQVTIAIKPFAIGLREDAGSRDMRLAGENGRSVLSYLLDSVMDEVNTFPNSLST